MLKRIVLNELDMCRRHGRSLSARGLKRVCELENNAPIGDGEFKAAMDDLETKRLITYEIEPISGDRLFSITDQGMEAIK